LRSSIEIAAREVDLAIAIDLGWQATSIAWNSLKSDSMRWRHNTAPRTHMISTFDSDFNTIYAVSTGFGRSAVAVIRVSGPQCSAILERLCPNARFKDREATLVTLRDEDRNAIDRALAIRFVAPRSYTGEDMIELQITGGRAVVSKALRALARCQQTRPAEAGEFARRAFANGKLDLVEVEGLALVLEAETEAQLRHATAMASGDLSRRIERARALLLRATSEIESLLDFSDVEDTAEVDLNAVLATVDQAKSVLGEILRHSVVSERLRDGMTVVIAGAPNVGKSTLLNHLANRDVAIVSPIPGTTRDSLEVAAEIEGYPITFIDTAGIRETVDPIEEQGISRTLKRGASADLILWLLDGEASQPAPSQFSKPVQKVRTKIDLASEQSVETNALGISAQTGFGVDLLVAKIAEFAREHFSGAGNLAFGTERQRAAALDAIAALDRILSTPRNPPEMVAEELRFAGYALGRVTGRIGVEEVLGEIFSRFCIGK
jgi:tRNA modification GTPase